MRTNLTAPSNETVLGMFDSMDFAVRVYRPNLYNDLFVEYTPETVLTFFHEYTHYVQFLSTAIGRRISYFRRLTTANRLKAISMCPRPISLPLTECIEKKKRENSKLAEFLNINKAIEGNISHFYTDWRNPINEVLNQFPSQTISTDFLRQHKPITLDVKEGAFIFHLPNGSDARFQVSSYQICEFMAFAVETDLANRNHFRPQVDEYLDIGNPHQLTYSMPILYLTQYASLEPVQQEPAYNPLLTSLIISCFLSLYMEIDYVQMAGAQEHRRMQETGPYRYPGRFLVRLLNFITRGYDIGSDIDYVQGNWLKLFNKMCNLINWPSFATIYKLFWDDFCNKEVAPLVMDSFPFTPHQAVIEPMIKREYMESLKALNIIWDHPHYIAFPYMLFKFSDLPCPQILYIGDDNQLLTLRIDKKLLKGNGQTAALKKEDVYSLWFIRHLTDKIWSGMDLGCFWPKGSETFFDSINYCDYSTKEECYARLKNLVKNGRQIGPLDHCVNPEWKEIVAPFYRLLDR